MRTHHSFRKTKRAVGFAVAAATASLLGTRANAQVLNWDGDGILPVNGGSGVWDSLLPRWHDGAAYVPWDNSGTSSAVFGATPGTVLVGEALNANDLTFTSSGYRLLNPSTSIVTISLQSGSVNTGIHTMEILPRIGGNNGVTKLGTGTAIYHGVNNYSGNTEILEGTWAMGNTLSSDIPDGSDVNIALGATLDMQYYGGAYNDTINALNGAGTVRMGKAFYGLSTVTGGLLTIRNGGDFSGSIIGDGARVTFSVPNLAGSLRLSGVNTFTGQFAIAPGGFVNLAGGSALADTSHIAMNTAAELTLEESEVVGGIGSAGSTSTANFIHLMDKNLTINGSINMQFQGIIDGTGKVIKTGRSVQQFATGANVSTYSGGTDVLEGVLLVSNDTKLGDLSGAVTLNGGTLSNFASGATGTALTHARNFILDGKGGAIQVLNNDSADRITTIVNPVTSTGSNATLTKIGPGTLRLSSDANTFNGGLIVDAGIVNTNIDIGTPFGTGPIRMNSGRLSVTPVGAANPEIKAVTDAGATFSYGAGAEILLDRVGNTTLTLSLGESSPTPNSVLVRQPGGTLTILPTGGASNLGSVDRLIVNGGVPTVNGIASPSIVSHVQGLTSTGGTFVGYDNTNGFFEATYTTTDLTISGLNDVVDQTAAVALGADTHVYALRASQPITGAVSLRIGNGSGAAGLIINGQTNVGAAAIATTALTFNGDDATIFTQNTSAGVIDAPITITGNGGLTKFGLGALRLNRQATYTGDTRIGAGILSIGINDALPTTTNLRFGASRGTAFSGSNTATSTLTELGNQTTLRLNGFNQTVASIASENQYALIDLGAGTLTVNQNTDTVFRGTIAGPGGTFHKAGAGTLVLNPFNGATVNTGTATAAAAQFITTYSKLRVTGGVVEVHDTRSLPNAPAALQTDYITLDGGTLRWAGIPTFTTDIGAAAAAQALGANRGLTLGPGGGTIDISNPFSLVTWQLNNAETTGQGIFNGPGDLIKTGDGTLRLGFGNSNTGRVIVKGGRIQFQQGRSLGLTPGVLVPDALTLDGGTIENNGTGVIENTRGVRVTLNNGTVFGNFTFNSPISGPGTLVKASQVAGNNRLILNAAATDFTGTVSVQQGILALPVSDALGNGTLELRPKFPVFVDKIAGAADSIHNNPVLLQAGSLIDFRVDGNNGSTNIGELVFNGKISGPNNFYKTAGTGLVSNGAGLGTLTLGGATNDFTGTAYVMTGPLKVTANNALGATSGATVIMGAAVSGTFVGSLLFSNVNYSAPEPVTVNGAGHTGLGAIRGLGNSRFAGPITLAGDTSVGAEAAGTLELSGRISGAGNLTKVDSGVVTLSNANNDLRGVVRNDAGTLEFAATHRIDGELSMGTATTTKIVAGNNLLRVKKLTGPTVADFKLDLVAGRLMVDYDGASPILDIRGWIDQARLNGGGTPWQGNGITSSLIDTPGNTNKAIGYAEASVVAPGGNWTGEPHDGTAVLARYTILGDTDLDGQVGFVDLLKVAANFGAFPGGNAVWSDGDSDFDGFVTFTDLLSVSANFGQALPAEFTSLPGDQQALISAAMAAVPEPGSMAMIALGAAAMMHRRRRTR